MNMKKLSLAVASVLICLQTAQAAAPVELLAPQAGDLSAATIAPAATPVNASGVANPDGGFGNPFATPNREAVAVSWALHGDVDLAAKPFLSQSRESWRKVTGAQLNAGIELHTSSPRALVRLQAIGDVSQREKEAIHPKFLQIKGKDGKALVDGVGMEAIVSAERMAKSDLPFASGTSTFRIHPDLGSGKFNLQAARLNDTQEYLINVVEPDSPFVLDMQAGAANYLHGQDLVLHSNLQGASGRHLMHKMDAELVSPAGRVFPLKFKADANHAYHAHIKLDANEVPAPGFWEVRTHVEGRVNGQTVQRSVRMALPVAMPVARLNGQTQLQQGANGGMSLQFGVDAASAGRYEVRGLLYGTAGGKLVPLAVAHSAKWLEAGKGGIDLTFDAALLQGTSAPYEIRDVGLLDQGRFAVLHKQARGLVLDANDVRRASVVIGAANSVTGGSFLHKPMKPELAQ